MFGLIILLCSIYSRVVVQTSKDLTSPIYDSQYEKLLTKDHIVVIYKEYCPYSRKALKTLTEKKIPFAKYERSENPGLSEYANNKFHYTKSPTIVVDGKFFGGNDVLQDTLSKNPNYFTLPYVKEGIPLIK